jgi:hypothetical protein
MASCLFEIRQQVQKGCLCQIENEFFGTYVTNVRHSGRLKRADSVKRGRGRPNLTWEESVKRYLKD